MLDDAHNRWSLEGAFDARAGAARGWVASGESKSVVHLNTPEKPARDSSAHLVSSSGL